MNYLGIIRNIHFYHCISILLVLRGVSFNEFYESSKNDGNLTIYNKIRFKWLTSNVDGYRRAMARSLRVINFQIFDFSWMVGYVTFYFNHEVRLSRKYFSVRCFKWGCAQSFLHDPSFSVTYRCSGWLAFIFPWRIARESRLILLDKKR